ncbi:MAG: hypothetical protein PHX30_03665 [Candidatus Pacebacteria bacterium]|jgi:hypothetical protein|nr:hypothetical protein [Candidatus Paceibacterota bacterium]
MGISKKNIPSDEKINNGPGLRVKQARESSGYLIGLSFSGTVRDISKGEISRERITKVIAGTRISNDEDFEKWIGGLKESPWGLDNDAEQYARDLWKKGLVEQPRLCLRSRSAYTGAGTYIRALDRGSVVYRNLGINPSGFVVYGMYRLRKMIKKAKGVN